MDLDYSYDNVTTEVIPQKSNLSSTEKLNEGYNLAEKYGALNNRVDICEDRINSYEERIKKIEGKIINFDALLSKNRKWKIVKEIVVFCFIILIIILFLYTHFGIFKLIIADIFMTLDELEKGNFSSSIWINLLVKGFLILLPSLTSLGVIIYIKNIVRDIIEIVKLTN
ncbi:hypothetical protein IX325_000702 [Fusobacterium necrophorum subsp. funduliforme]|uniref:hypothetical protein n=1 Tax=Fusobacterium necrophorum TaxID=859 RepID=UPI001B8C23A9|nr:hypothetical protein [Fusobacterium necrophorum]MBR8722394.1 hypothetical protein [Fusobacterium necrophorum subsp. funduliforme]